jgi:FdhE protein
MAKSAAGAKEVLFSGGMDMEEMKEVLDLYRDLYPLSERGLRLKNKLRTPGKEEAAMRLKEGFTLLEPEDLMPTENALHKKAGEVLDVLIQHSEGKSTVIGSSDTLNDKKLFAQLVRTYLEDGEEKLREDIGTYPSLNPELALFVVFNAVKGSFRAAGMILGDIDTQAWEYGLCPVCGGAPAVACLEDEGGKRYLVCHRCETKWHFARMMCPYCGNNDHDNLGFFTVEDGQGTLRVDFCNSCKGYIKTWDIREMENPHPEVEDLKTARYDLAAEGEGYRRGAPNIFGVWVGFDLDVEQNGDDN